MSHDRKVVLLTTLMMTVIMSVAFSGLLSFLSLGLLPAWPAAWARGFAFAWPMQAAAALALGPVVRRVATKLVAGRQMRHA